MNLLTTRKRPPRVKHWGFTARRTNWTEVQRHRQLREQTARRLWGR